MDGWIGKVFFHLVKCYLAFFIPFTKIMFLNHLENRIALSRHLKDESGYVIQPSYKASNFFLGSWRGQVLYYPYLVWINLDSFLVEIGRAHV